MNRTIEQWRDFDCCDAAYNDPREFISDVLQNAISDLQELARQRDELRGMLEVMTELCAIKYGNLDADVFAEICKSRDLLQSIKEQTK